MLTDDQCLPIQQIQLPWFHQSVAEVSVLRLDLIDPLISGNKYFKLKYNLLRAEQEGHDTVLSFGGYWSNHLHALAAAGQRQGLKTIGVIRGEQPTQLNDCLSDAQAMGMQLHYVSREQYRCKHQQDFVDELQQRFGDFFLIPEGGANREGVTGCQEILSPPQAADYSHVLLACGTGTTMAGLVSRIATPVIGIQVLKGEGYLQKEVQGLLEAFELSAKASWQVLDQFHCGGYARCPEVLSDFMHTLENECDIPFEPVYSGKLMLAVYRLLQQGYFPEGSKLLLIHGGGLQGGRGQLGQ